MATRRQGKPSTGEPSSDGPGLQTPEDYTRTKLALSLSSLVGVLATVDEWLAGRAEHEGLLLALGVAVDRVRRHLDFARSDAGAGTLCTLAEAMLAVAVQARDELEGAARLRR